jgi:cytidine deaminase
LESCLSHCIITPHFFIDMAEKVKHTFTFEEYTSADELSESERNLLKAAQAACATAYAPYSGFCVGAALLLANGVIVPGSNQENAAYPDGLCAERVAFFTAGAQHRDVPILKVAVAARPADSNTSFVPAAPCGSCRQVMLEYEYKQRQPIELITQWADQKIVKIQRITDLLPFSFTNDSMQVVE